MANPTYSKADEKLILGMKKNKKGRPTEAALEKVAKRLKKTTGAIYQKWSALMSKPKAHAVVATSPAATATIQVAPMKFKEIDFIARGRWIDPKEEAAMKAGLDDALKNSFPNGKAVVFPARLMERARNYLAEVCPKGVFVFHAHTDKGYKILSKKN